jgi:hypothetical protein
LLIVEHAWGFMLRLLRLSLSGRATSPLSPRFALGRLALGNNLLVLKQRHALAQLSFSGAYFEVVNPSPLVNRNGYDPANGKESDDEVAERAEVANKVPKSSLQADLLRHQPECLYAADCEGHHKPRRK